MQIAVIGAGTSANHIARSLSAFGHIVFHINPSWPTASGREVSWATINEIADLSRMREAPSWRMALRIFLRSIYQTRHRPPPMVTRGEIRPTLKRFFRRQMFSHSGHLPRRLKKKLNR